MTTPARALAGLILVGVAVRPCDGGHDLFIQIGFQEVAPSGQPRYDEPVAVGVPIPESAELFATERLVLVGAQSASYRVLERWPNGALRWVLVRARVDIPKSGHTSEFYLTTGSPPPGEDGEVEAIRAGPDPPSFSVVGRAVGVEAYNDARAFAYQLSPLPSDVARSFVLEPSSSFAAAGSAMRRYLRCAEPGCVALRRQADGAIRMALERLGRPEPQADRGLPLDTVGDLYRLTGEESLREAYLEWGESARPELVEASGPWGWRQRLLQLVDLWRVSGDEGFGEDAWAVLERRLEGDPLGASSLLPLAMMATESRRLDPDRAVRALELLEEATLAALAIEPDTAIADLAWVHGYMLSGDRSLLGRAAAAMVPMAPGELTPARQSLLDLLARPDRYRVWRELGVEITYVDRRPLKTWVAPAHAVGYWIEGAPESLRMKPRAAGERERVWWSPRSSFARSPDRFLERSAWEIRQLGRSARAPSVSGPVPRTADFRFTPASAEQPFGSSSSGRHIPVVLLVSVVIGLIAAFLVARPPDRE